MEKDDITMLKNGYYLRRIEVDGAEEWRRQAAVTDIWRLERLLDDGALGEVTAEVLPERLTLKNPPRGVRVACWSGPSSAASTFIGAYIFPKVDLTNPEILNFIIETFENRYIMEKPNESDLPA